MNTLTRITAKQSLTRTFSAALLASSLMVFGAATAWAQKAKLDLSQLDKLAGKASEVTNVTLDGSMLKMAAEQMSQKAATAKSQNKAFAANMVQRLKGIYVKSFEFDQPGGYSKADLEGVTKQLESGGWKAIVHVEEKKSGETTGVYVMQEGGETVGMAVVAAEPKELTVVNLVGPIDFSQLGSLGSLGGLGTLGGLAGTMSSSKPELQHRQATTTEKAPADSK